MGLSTSVFFKKALFISKEHLKNGRFQMRALLHCQVVYDVTEEEEEGELT